jgi:anti-anti-sigma regulatory factor
LSAEVETLDDYSVIRLDGACTLASAGDLKRLLVEGLASGKNLRVDLDGVEEIDLAALQLLWAVGREAERAGVGIAVRVTEAVVSAARAAGFERIAGLAVSGDGWPK